MESNFWEVEDGFMISETQNELPLTEHLRELRQRLIRSLVVVSILACLSYAFIDPIFKALSIPLLDVLPEGRSLIFTSYPEAFFTYLKLAITTGIFLASPWILFELWAFIAPGLYAHEKKLLFPFIIFGSAFFVGGGLFGYFVVFPTAFKFLAGYESDMLTLYPSISEYFTLVVRLLLGFGLAFELPLILVFLGLLGIVNTTMLRRNRKYALLGAFIIAAIFTPTPDVLNQTLLAVPLLLLYEISIWALVIIQRLRS